MPQYLLPNWSRTESSTGRVGGVFCDIDRGFTNAVFVESVLATGQRGPDYLLPCMHHPLQEAVILHFAIPNPDNGITGQNTLCGEPGSPASFCFSLQTKGSGNSESTAGNKAPWIAPGGAVYRGQFASLHQAIHHCLEVLSVFFCQANGQKCESCVWVTYFNCLICPAWKQTFGICLIFRHGKPSISNLLPKATCTHLNFLVTIVRLHLKRNVGWKYSNRNGMCYLLHQSSVYTSYPDGTGASHSHRGAGSSQLSLNDSRGCTVHIHIQYLKHVRFA